MKTTNKKVKGFTLIELIIVIAIIGVLAAILVPSLINNIAKSSVSKANSNAKEIYTTASTFISDAVANGIPVNLAGDDYTVSGTETEVDWTTVTTLDDDTLSQAIAGELTFTAGERFGYTSESNGSAISASAYMATDGDKYGGAYPNIPTYQEEKADGVTMSITNLLGYAADGSF